MNDAVGNRHGYVLAMAFIQSKAWQAADEEARAAADYFLDQERAALRLALVAGPRYRLWSLEHGMWWRANREGYTSFEVEAGVYTLDEAAAVVMDHIPPGEEIAVRVGTVVDMEQLKRAAKYWSR